MSNTCCDRETKGKKDGIWVEALRTFEHIADEMGLSKQQRIRLCQPQRIIQVSLTPKLIHAQLENPIIGWRVQHNNSRGPCKGGLRAGESIDLDDIKGLALDMVWKCALHGLPLGGAKGGIKADLDRFHPEDREIIMKTYIRMIGNDVGPQKDVLAPDMGTNSKDMGYMQDAFSWVASKSPYEDTVATSRPLSMGGIEGRSGATGRGVVYTILNGLNHLGMQIKGSRCAVQGFGKVGKAVVEDLTSNNARIIGLSDITGGLYDPEGLDIRGIFEWTGRGEPLGEYPDAKKISNEELLELECDVLVPAAMENQITCENAQRIKAGIVAEGANGPTTFDASDVLRERGIFVIPDILCNGGGVIVSFIEMSQSAQLEQFNIETVNRKLRERIDRSFDTVIKYSEKNSVDLRTAAHMVAVKNVIEAMEDRGFQP